MLRLSALSSLFIIVSILCGYLPQLSMLANAYRSSYNGIKTVKTPKSFFSQTLQPTHHSSSNTKLHFKSFTKSSSSSSQTKLFVFDRLFRLVSSNVNGLMKKMEDPEKIIEQAVTDMQSDLVKIRQSYAEVSATQKRFERQREAAEAESELWYRRAQTAMQKNDELLAREALTRRKTQKELVESLTKQITVQAQASEKLYISMMALEEKIVEAKRQKESLIARARTAKTALQVNEMLNSLTTTSSSMEAFNRMKDKVDSLETQAEIAGEMAGLPASKSLEDKFKELDGDDALESELALLRQNSSNSKQLPGRQKVFNETPVEASFDLPSDLDMEYEKLKRELRGR